MGSVSVCLLKGEICRSVSFQVHVPVCAFLFARVFVHLYIHIPVNMHVSVCVCAFLSPCVSVDLLTNVHVVYASVYKCVYVLGECAAAPPLPQATLGSTEPELREQYRHPFVYRIPWVPQRRKRGGRRKSQEERKRTCLFQLEARGRPFSTKEETRGRAQRQVTFSGMEKEYPCPFTQCVHCKEVTLGC